MNPIDIICNHQFVGFDSRRLENFTKVLLEWIRTGHTNVRDELQLPYGAYDDLMNATKVHCGGTIYERHITEYLENNKEATTLCADAHIGLIYLILSLDTRIH